MTDEILTLSFFEPAHAAAREQNVAYKVRADATKYQVHVHKSSPSLKVHKTLYSQAYDIFFLIGRCV